MESNPHLFCNGDKMSLSSEEDAWLSEFLQSASDNEDALSEWELNFIQDQRKRYDEYGMDTRMSPKQWNILFRAAKEKLGLDLPDGATYTPSGFR